jgi:hypothetical protein
VVRTVAECIQAVLWNGTLGFTLIGHEVPNGLTAVPVVDMPPSQLVVAWKKKRASPLVRSFVRIVTEAVDLPAPTAVTARP